MTELFGNMVWGRLILSNFSVWRMCGRGYRSLDRKTDWGRDGGVARNREEALAEPWGVLGSEVHVQPGGQLAAMGRLVSFPLPGVRGWTAC